MKFEGLVRMVAKFYSKDSLAAGVLASVLDNGYWYMSIQRYAPDKYVVCKATAADWTECHWLLVEAWFKVSLNPELNGWLGRNRRWVTRDNRAIQIKDMSDAHVINTVRFLARTARDTATLTPQIGDFLPDYEQEESWQDFLHDQYRYLYNEAVRRGLPLESELNPDGD